MRKKVRLIIEVDEKYYEACKDAVAEPYPSQIEEIIANGTPLPKGHGRLIDAGDVDNHIIGSVDLRDCPTIIEADKE